MTHHAYVPQYPLNRFVSQLTYYKDFKPAHAIDRFLPNGNIEVIIDLTDTPKFIYDNNTLQKIQGFKKVWISGLRSTYITIPSGADAEMMIIEFKKGMVYPFLGRPVIEIADQVVEADLILDPVFMDIREALPAQQFPLAMFSTTENMLTKKFLSKLSVNPFVDFAVDVIIARPGTQTIKNIADKTGYSSKHFIKIFSDHVGVTPKSFSRILRFQKALEEIEYKGRLNWVALALECGYYDQAHFISDFKNFSGFTPQEYMKRKSNAWVNYVAVG